MSGILDFVEGSAGYCRIVSVHILFSLVGSRSSIIDLVLGLFIVALDLLLRTRLLNHPVKDKVVFVAHSVEEVFEELSEVADVWLLLELEAAAIVEVDTELIREVFGQRFDRSGQFLVPDLFVLLLLCSGRKTLPRQAAFVKVHEHEAKGF